MAEEKKKLDEVNAKIEELESQLSSRSRQHNHRVRAEIEEYKKRAYRLESLISKLENSMTRSKNMVEEYKVKIPFIIQPTVLLGKDRDLNQYFFFSDEPSSIYIRMKPQRESYPAEWRALETEVNFPVKNLKN